MYYTKEDLHSTCSGHVLVWGWEVPQFFGWRYQWPAFSSALYHSETSAVWPPLDLCLTGNLWILFWVGIFWHWNLPRRPHVHLCLPKLNIPKVTISWSLKVRNCEPLSLHWAMMSYRPVTMKAFRLSRNSLVVQNPFSFSAHFLLQSCPFPVEAGCYLLAHWHSAFHLRSAQKHLLMKQNEWIRETAGWLAGAMWSLLLWLPVCCWITWERKERT